MPMIPDRAKKAVAVAPQAPPPSAVTRFKIVASQAHNAAEPGPTDPMRVSPAVALGAASRRREQDARIHRLIRVAGEAHFRGSREVTISVRDLMCLIAEAKIPFDLERMRA